VARPRRLVVDERLEALFFTSDRNELRASDGRCRHTPDTADTAKAVLGASTAHLQYADRRALLDIHESSPIDRRAHAGIDAATRSDQVVLRCA